MKRQSVLFSVLCLSVSAIAHADSDQVSVPSALVLQLVDYDGPKEDPDAGKPCLGGLLVKGYPRGLDNHLAFAKTYVSLSGLTCELLFKRKDGSLGAPRTSEQIVARSTTEQIPEENFLGQSYARTVVEILFGSEPLGPSEPEPSVHGKIHCVKEGADWESTKITLNDINKILDGEIVIGADAQETDIRAAGTKSNKLAHVFDAHAFTSAVVSVAKSKVSPITPEHLSQKPAESGSAQ